MHTGKHWEKVYSNSAEDELSWFQQHPALSLSIIRQYQPLKTASIIDVGGGASRLVDDLLADGYTNLTILDISNEALARSKSRLGEQSSRVKWITTDITRATLPRHEFDVWHDRAVFHFLTSAEDRHVYVETVLKALKPGGLVIIATFAEDGPQRCSGLPVNRYSASELHAQFGEQFDMLGHQKESHHTPRGDEQKFVYCYFQRVVSQGIPDRLVSPI